MNKQYLWDYLKRNEEEIKAGRMIVDCFEFEDVKGAIEDMELTDDQVVTLIDAIQENVDGEYGVGWGTIRDTATILFKEED
jgi:hypothetical protein